VRYRQLHVGRGGPSGPSAQFPNYGGVRHAPVHKLFDELLLSATTGFCDGSVDFGRRDDFLMHVLAHGGAKGASARLGGVQHQRDKLCCLLQQVKGWAIHKQETGTGVRRSTSLAPLTAGSWQHMHAWCRRPSFLAGAVTASQRSFARSHCITVAPDWCQS
jgi:hypothetical protein